MKNILIVDDDDDLRDAIRTVLEDTYGIEEAGNKQEVYDKLEKFKADLIILDVMMDTASSGFELARELKNSAKYKKINILMLTSVDKVMNIDFKSEAGNPDWLPVEGYIQKPLEPRALLEKVANILA